MPVTGNVTNEKKSRGAPKKDVDPWGGTRTRGICFTNFGLKIDYLPDDVQFIAFGQEVCPSTQREHQQGFAYTPIAQRFSWWSKKFPKGMHMEIMRGTFADNERYCSKEGQYTEIGTKPMKNGASRNAHDIVVLMEEGMRPTQIARTYGHLFETVARTNAFCERIYNEIEQEKALVEMKEKTKELHPHQQHALDLLFKQTDRKILWIWSSCGNVGKSHLATHVVAHYNGILVQGEVKRMIYGFIQQKNPYVVVDLARTQEDHHKSIYQFLEQVKNGMLFNTFQSPGMVCFQPPKVVVFANFKPDMEAWSDDRYQIVDWSEVFKEWYFS